MRLLITAQCRDGIVSVEGSVSGNCRPQKGDYLTYGSQAVAICEHTNFPVEGGDPIIIAHPWWGPSHGMTKHDAAARLREIADQRNWEVKVY